MFDWMDDWYKPSKLEEEGYADTVMMLASWLKELADKHEMVDVGDNVAKTFGVRQTTLDSALSLLEKDGYLTYGGLIQQATAVRRIVAIKVLCKPGIDQKDIFTDKVHHLA